MEGTENIAELCKKHQTFPVYISTDYVFNGEKGMYEENDEPDPVNYYGLTKLKGEESIKNLTDEYCIARASVIYGSIPATGKINFALWLLNKLKRREKAKIVTDQWNSPTLNINLANMVLEVLERKLTGIFHLAGATRLSRYEFAKFLAENFSLDMNLITPVFSKERAREYTQKLSLFRMDWGKYMEDIKSFVTVLGEGEVKEFSFTYLARAILS